MSFMYVISANLVDTEFSLMIQAYIHIQDHLLEYLKHTPLL